LYELRPAEFMIRGKVVVVLTLEIVEDAVRSGGEAEFGFWSHAPTDVVGNGTAASAFERNIACAPCGFRLNTIPA
jgi:hypothetical protein